MKNSTTSFRSSNRFVSENRRNYHSSSNTTAMQQQQIEQLQQKVDMILMHNNKLIQQNMQLRQLLQSVNARQITQVRSNTIDTSQIYRLKRQLQLKSIELEQLSQFNTNQKHSIRMQIDDLNQVIKRLSQHNDELTIQRQEMLRKLSKGEQQKQRQINKIRQQLQNQLYENSLKKEIQHKQQLRERQQQFNKKMEQKMQQWQQERSHLEDQKMNTIISLQQKLQKQKQQMRKEIENNFKKIIQKIEDDANENCRKARDESEKYIKFMLQTQKQQEQQTNELLKNQIEELKNSLAQRQKIIQNLLKTHLLKSGPHTNTYYDEVQQLRQRIKQVTQNFFKQAELLKVKMAAKHDIDIREMIKVYENKITILTQRIGYLQHENMGLRQKYEDQIRSKMKQRQRFQIQVSKLKNYIRKMKIELQSYGKQMRLNIEGIKSQANSFSMSIIGELGQQKNKKLFYQQQIRKMREVIDLKQQEMEVLHQQNEQKVKYLQDKMKSNKANIQQLKKQLQEKQQKYRGQIQYHKAVAKDELRKQREARGQQKQQLQKQIMDLRVLTGKLQQNIRNAENEKNKAFKDMQKLTNQLQNCKSHIDAMRLQMDMMAENPAHDTNSALKSHYQRIIQQMHNDKLLLKQANQAQSEQLAKIIAKYKILQKSMQKTLSTMKKKTQLQQRVMELGMDNNLVKNLSQIFRKQTENKENKQ